MRRRWWRELLADVLTGVVLAAYWLAACGAGGAAGVRAARGPEVDDERS
ncbi:hypothetical protein ACFFQW_16265 [Umezawaea endophytica]|uniref:Uncharacterized protein n=1 Tax=Umezawaea endophytica TaxID=1654476 RepID=A0A9X2VT23_9PSEU|nr:hypothetical protein [Umezawaea endophytica]MCS7481584.1 hypothetical protein [Umezawaea endophytica]